MIWLITQEAATPGWQILWMFGSLFGYALGMGVVQRAYGKTFDESPVGLVWPVVGPYMIGSWLVDRMTRPRLPKAQVIK